MQVVAISANFSGIYVVVEIELRLPVHLQKLNYYSNVDIKNVRPTCCNAVLAAVFCPTQTQKNGFI